jgi:hypothetical protein
VVCWYRVFIGTERLSLNASPFVHSHRAHVSEPAPRWGPHCTSAVLPMPSDSSQSICVGCLVAGSSCPANLHGSISGVVLLCRRPFVATAAAHPTPRALHRCRAGSRPRPVRAQAPTCPTVCRKFGMFAHSRLIAKRFAACAERRMATSRTSGLPTWRRSDAQRAR